MHLLPEIQVLQLYFNACKNKKASPIFTQVSIIYYWISAICSLRPYHHNSQVCPSSLLSTCLIHSKLRISFLTRGDKGKPPDNNNLPNGTLLVIIHPMFTEHLLALMVKKESACKAEDLGLIPGWEDPLEKGTATHSSILTWRIPWTEEPGGLKSMRSQTVGHN